MSELRMANGEWRVANGELGEGIAALRAGRREVARRWLAQAVCADPGNATAWLWLSRCVDDVGQRRECLERVLRTCPGRQAPGPLAQGQRVQGLDPASAAAQRIVGAGNDADSLGSKPQAEKPKDAKAPSQLTEAGSSVAVSPVGPNHRATGRFNALVLDDKPLVLWPRDKGYRAWRRRLVLMALAVALIALACVVAPRAGWPASQAQPAGGEALEASGIVRADEVLIASEWSGRIAAIPVGEGDTIATGDAIVQLDTSLLEAQIKAARAAVTMAEAGLAQAKAGARPGQIAVAEAQLAQAQAACDAATQVVSDTLALVDNPQEMRLQIAVTQAQAEAAQHHVARAVAIKDAAEMGKQKFEDLQKQWDGGGRQKIFVRRGPVSELPAILPPEIVDLLPSLGDGVHTFGDLELHLHGGTYDLYSWVNVHIPLELHLMPNNWWQAWVGVNTAVAQQEGVQASLAHLYAQRAHPQDLEAKADEALASLAQAEAQVAAAQAQVDGLKAGPTDEQIAALEARVAQARAALDSLLAQRAMMEIASPVDGVVADVAAHAGEVASAGAALLTVANLSEVRLVVYLPETHVGLVRMEQAVQVAVDSFPDRVFEGQVIHIASRAEFTPRNVTTKEERVNLVFAVEIHLPNDDGALKPGMPADAVFGE